MSVFEGVLTALVTPFRDGEIDEDALRALVERQIEAGIDGLVPCGSTGESATLSHAEHRRVVEIVVQATRGRVPVVAGTGSNNTREAIELTLHAKDAGADGALLISPYYNKPTQEGIVLHYAEIARRTAFPLVLYNIPGRTASNMLPATIARLADLEQVVGRQGVVRRPRPDLRGDRPLSGRASACCRVTTCSRCPMLAVGGKGVICDHLERGAAPRWCRWCARSARGDVPTRRAAATGGCCRSSTRCSAETEPDPGQGGARA